MKKHKIRQYGRNKKMFIDTAGNFFYKVGSLYEHMFRAQNSNLVFSDVSINTVYFEVIKD